MYDKFGRISFAPDSYKEKKDYYGSGEIDEFQMYSDIASVLQIGIKNGYQFHVHSDGYCVMLDFNYDDAEMAGATLEWVGEDEYIGSYAADAMYEYAHEYDPAADGDPGVSEV